jgi:2'-5' RNA ligase
MRVFACSLLGAPLQGLYRTEMARVIAVSGGSLRPVPRDSAHLTYAFASHAPDDQVGELVDALAGVAGRHEPLGIRFGPPVVLYGGSEARLVCAPVTDGEPGVSRLAADVVEALAAVLSAQGVTGSRSHHVTLARFRKRTPRSEARAVERALEQAVFVAPPERVARLQLMASALTPGGPVYSALADLPLGRDTRQSSTA